MRIKSAIVPAIHSLGLITGFSTRRARSIRGARILTLHGVGDEEYSAVDFETHLRYLAKNFSVVSLADALDENKQSHSPHNVVLTFDDGLRNNFEIAYPVLRRLNLPATFFVCPGLIEKSRWLWTHETRARLQFLGEKRGDFFSQWMRNPEWSTEQFVGWMKHLSPKTRDEVESSLRELTGEFEPTPEQKQKYDLMNWDELCSLDPALITIGSHTVTHAILSHLDPGELAFEISTSRKLLEEKLRRKVEFFCYPNGSRNQAVIEEARKHYRAAVSTEAGLVTKSSDLHCLPRIGIAKNLPLLAWRLYRPGA